MSYVNTNKWDRWFGFHTMECSLVEPMVRFQHEVKQTHTGGQGPMEDPFHDQMPCGWKDDEHSNLGQRKSTVARQNHQETQTKKTAALVKTSPRTSFVTIEGIVYTKCMHGLNCVVSHLAQPLHRSLRQRFTMESYVLTCRETNLLIQHATKRSTK